MCQAKIQGKIESRTQRWPRYPTSDERVKFSGRCIRGYFVGKLGGLKNPKNFTKKLEKTPNIPEKNSRFLGGSPKNCGPLR